MSGSEKLCLQWNDYRESIVNSFRMLKDDKDLVDVTLVCEDGQQVEAYMQKAGDSWDISPQLFFGFSAKS